MAVDMAVLTGDLAAETRDLAEMLAPLADADWDLPTPAIGWAIRDQVSHLAYFDEAATLAATDPGRFRQEAERLIAAGVDFTEIIARDNRHLAPSRLREWLARARSEYIRVFAGLAPSARLPWYGPPMSAASSVTARLMETWAHGQDIADTLGRQREPAARLRHVAHLGVATMAFSFQLRGQPVPHTPVRVVLVPPGTAGGLGTAGGQRAADGQRAAGGQRAADGPSPPGGPGARRWTWGPPDADDRVEGDALDFCLLVTQRRNRADTGLRATGPVADAWLDLAQAFAGPPGPGRPPQAGPGSPGAGDADEEGSP